MKNLERFCVAELSATEQSQVAGNMNNSIHENKYCYRAFTH